MKKIISGIAVVLIVLSGSAKADDLSVAIKNFQRQFGAQNAKLIRETAFENIYAVGSSENQIPIYFDKDLTGVANNGVSGWTDPNTENKLSPEKFQALMKNVVNSLPMDKAILVSRGGKPTMAIYSAVDCTYCVKLEKGLAKLKGVSYYVFPSFLSADNRHFAMDVYCAKNPAAAWEGLMTRINTPSPTSDCGYPSTVIRDFGGILHSGSTPLIIFADATFPSSNDADVVAREAKAKE